MDSPNALKFGRLHEFVPPIPRNNSNNGIFVPLANSSFISMAASPTLYEIPSKRKMFGLNTLVSVKVEGGECSKAKHEPAPANLEGQDRDNAKRDPTELNLPII